MNNQSFVILIGGLITTMILSYQMYGWGQEDAKEALQYNRQSVWSELYHWRNPRVSSLLEATFNDSIDVEVTYSTCPDLAGCDTIFSVCGFDSDIGYWTCVRSENLEKAFRKSFFLITTQ